MTSMIRIWKSESESELLEWLKKNYQNELRFENQKLDLSGGPFIEARGLRLIWHTTNGELEIDWIKNYRSLKILKGKNEPLIKSLGGAKTVYDLTTGIGQDSCFFLKMGLAVRGFERNSFLKILNHWAVTVLLKNYPQHDLQFFGVDCREWFLAQSRMEGVAYLDPMFPEKMKTSALPKKEMQILRSEVGEDQDLVEVMEVAAQKFGRLVLKRPHSHPQISIRGARLDHRIEGRTVDYDVYLAL